MGIIPLHIAFSSYAIIGLTLLILAGSTAIYLLRLSSKSQTTWFMIGFFSLVALSGAATILANAFLYWDRFFDPWQDFWILAAGAMLAQFAYSFPRSERSQEAKFVKIVTGGLAFLSLAYCLIFNFRFLFGETPGLGVDDAYYLLLPLGTLFIVIIFLRRSLHFSFQAGSSASSPGIGHIWRHLIHPQGENAKIFRSLAFALSLAFLPGLQTLIGLPYPYGYVLSNIGSILAIVAIALVYFNYAPEVNSFMAKLVGITLASVLLIFAIFGAGDIYTSQSGFGTARLQVIASIHNVLLNNGNLQANLPQVAYIVSWDAARPGDAGAYQQIYRATDEDNFALNRLVDENGKGFLETLSQPVSGMLAQLTKDEIRVIRRFWVYPQRSGQADYLGYIFVSGSRAYEIGVSMAAVEAELSALVSKWLLLILASSAFILLVFPLFFRRTLVEPLNNLLDGITRLNQGDLDTVIPISFNDEIGYLTQSFNRMASSLKEANLELQNRAVALEAEVIRRTKDLIQSNASLEKENKDRQMAETRLNQQLIYQKALSGCSQSLLLAAVDEISQQEVLIRALGNLRSAAQASRAYIFHTFDDSDLGPCIGMLAEVCASGIPAHINNPVNQKFPLSHLPEDFVSDLMNRKPYGGPVKLTFGSTPDLLEAFINQSPPLLSVMFFPLFSKDQFWGFIGFDDCISEREWDEQEISMLRTASEMIENTLQRWEAEAKLNETLDLLELRVEERTAELRRLNEVLVEEIQARQHTQNNLEKRLQIEGQLVNASASLQELNQPGEGVRDSLKSLGQIMDAGRAYLIEFELHKPNWIREYYEWHRLDLQPLSREVAQDLFLSLTWLQDRLQAGETIYLDDIALLPAEAYPEKEIMQARGVQSLVLAPLLIDQRLRGILGCSNLDISTQTVKMNLNAFELVAGMLSNYLEREYLIQSLEEQVAERTRQLTTFFDMAMLSSEARDLRDILQPTLAAVTRIAACDSCSIHLINEDDSSLQLTAQQGMPAIFLESFSEIEIDPDFAAWLENVGDYQGYSAESKSTVFPDPFCLPDYRTFFAARLKTGGQVLGILSCYRVAEEPFSPFQGTILTALGEILGIIVENYHLRIEAEELAVIEERQRLAREIHDAVSQSVYSLSLFARSAQDALDEGSQSKLESNLQDLEVTSLQAMREMRLLLYQLRDQDEDAGIAAALEARFNQLERRLGVQATYEVDPNLVMTHRVRHEVWRIITEALNNSLKHASAAHVHVQMAFDDSHLVVMIEDDGSGFNVSSDTPGMGLNNMRQRTAALEGRFNINSTPGQGTQVKLEFPQQE